MKTFEDKVNNKMKNPIESQPTKKKHVVSLSGIFNFVGALVLFKKDNVQQKLFQQKTWVFLL